jgi:SpoVK/Ycf46/Vps4 family AAA+-type ATPase
LALRKLHTASEAKYRTATPDYCLTRNVKRLAELVGLTDTDCRILELAVLLQNERLLDDTADWLGMLSSVKLFYVLSQLLNVPEQAIRTALAAQGTLARSGLVSVERSGSGTLRSKLNLLSDNFADHIFSSEADPVSLLRDTVIPSLPAHLTFGDFAHIEQMLAILRAYLKQSIQAKRTGVNVFLYGRPGTGKSQLAKLLAQELNCQLFEITSEDGDGDPVNGERRLRAFRAAQSFFNQRRALLLFDEVEDVFSDGDSFLGRKSTAQTRKAWINRMLEENPVPTLWLSNSIHELDPAFIRRFDMVIELFVPPRKQRERIIQEASADLLSKDSIGRIAESEALAPAVVTRAASVARAVRDQLDPSGASDAVERLINATLAAQGHPQIRRNNSNRLPELYDPAFIHADTDLAQLAAGVKRAKAARLCLYGPPGTGKTAFGRWLAEQMDVPILIKRASDLMSKWVGENEQNIARAFKQAEQDGALLLIDEVDSFLQDRRGGRNSWEITLVNEMLTQMEKFSGVFIASTNLLHDLDQAALRRFDLKVKFDFLHPHQAIDLFRRYCDKLTLGVVPPSLIERIKRLPMLTPGDFAVATGQNHLRQISSPIELLDALEKECALKQMAKPPIGFV